MKPIHVKPAAPTAAVIWMNGHREVSVLAAFKSAKSGSDSSAVTRKLVRLKIVGGPFAGRKAPTITCPQGPSREARHGDRRQYHLRFEAGTTASPTVIQPSSTTKAAAWEGEPSS